MLCTNSDREWTRATALLATMAEEHVSPNNTIFYVCLNKDGNIYRDNVIKIHTLAEATNRLNQIIRSERKMKQEELKKKMKKRSRKTVCSFCEKKFSHPKFLSQHLIGTSKGACTVCGKILIREKLYKHLEKFHRKVMNICKICQKCFDDQPSLDRHKELHRPDLPQCRICKQGFKTERSLRAHMFAHTLFNCPHCTKSFENRKCYAHHKELCSESKRHITIVDDVEMYKCHDCGRQYSKKPSLRIHIIQKHLNVLPFVCQICGKRSSTKAHHKSHELVHKDKTERKLYQCKCGAQMRTALGFRMHQRIHSGEKPFECKECGDKFLSASRRLDHIKRRHNGGVTAHTCGKCGAGFIRPFELRKHYRNAHLECYYPVK